MIRLPLAILLDVVILVVIAVLVRANVSPQHDSRADRQGAGSDCRHEHRFCPRPDAARGARSPRSDFGGSEVKALRGKADVDFDVVVSRDSNNLPEKQKEIDRALRQVLNKQLGLQMAGKPRVHIRMDGMDEQKPAPLPVELPAPAAAAEPAPVIAVVEPTKPEAPTVVAEVKEVKEEPPSPTPVQDTMSLRPESETKPDLCSRVKFQHRLLLLCEKTLFCCLQPDFDRRAGGMVSRSG